MVIQAFFDDDPVFQSKMFLITHIYSCSAGAGKARFSSYTFVRLNSIPQFRNSKFHGTDVPGGI
jgi:hypothetical protein